MNTKTLLTISALALGLFPLGLPTHADDAMGGMDMGGMKMSQKPMSQKPMSQKPAPLSVTATVNPAAPRTGDNTLDLTITGFDGKPMTGLKLTTSVAMTSMDMGTTHPTVVDTGGGHYTAKVNFSMNGPWRVVVRNQANKIAVLNFEAGAKTPWKLPQIKAGGGTPSKPDAPAGNPMPAMDMSDQAAKPAALPSAGTRQSETTKPADQAVGGGSNGASSMGGMDMKGMTGIADMKTATVPQLQETGTYTATGDEDWSKQTGFGHNAGMVAMMNQMMVGGSGMEGMKMPAMKMDFGEKNYAKPDADDADTSMPGMDMGGGKAANKKAGQGGNIAGMDMGGKDKPGDMAGMKMDAKKMDAKKMDAAPPAAKPDAPPSDAKAMPGMDMAAPISGVTPSATAPVKITATTASTPKAGDNPLTISITDAQGKPVTGATLTTSVAMTSMDMGTAYPAVTEKGAGQYAATVNFSMAGPWRVKVKVTAPGRKPQTKAFDFSAK